jgi:hypothetical protein
VRRRAERGFSLMLVIFMILILGLAIGLLHGLLSSRVGAYRQQSRRATLRALGDGAMAATLAHLSAQPFYRGLPEERLGEGKISTDVSPRPHHTVHVSTTARIPGWIQHIEADVDLAAGQPVVTTWLRTPPRRDGAG